MECFQLKGVRSLSAEEKSIIDKISKKYYPKIKRKLHNEMTLQLHVKTYSKGGERKKYSAHLKAIAPTRIFESKEDDWDMTRTLHKVYRNMEAEVNKAFSKKTSYAKKRA